jgi:hypothetical protein
MVLLLRRAATISICTAKSEKGAEVKQCSTT